MKIQFLIALVSISIFSFGQIDSKNDTIVFRGEPIEKEEAKYILILGTENYKIDTTLLHKLEPKWIKKIEVLKSEKEKYIYGNGHGILLIYPKKRYFTTISLLLESIPNIPNQMDSDSVKVEKIVNSFFSQDLSVKINQIANRLAYVTENESDINLYDVLHADGQIARPRKVFGIKIGSKASGGFAETYIYQDTMLIKLTIGKREFYNDDKTLSTNEIDVFLFDNDYLTYYYEEKYYEQQNKADSLIHSVEYYLDKGNILSYIQEGTFDKDKNNYLDLITMRANSKKNFLKEILQY
jgi:hypothetical protein